MKSRKVIFQSDGFHVIPAKLFSKTAASFESEIRVIWEEKNIISDGKSILGLMALELKKGMAIVLTADGHDEDRAVEELANLVENGL